MSALEAANALYGDDIFLAVAPDFYYTVTLYEINPNDPLYGDQWNIHGENGIKSHLAWDITTGIGSVVVAVLDTGVELDHPDLIEGLVQGFNATNDTVLPGWPSYFNETDAHGTKCAGVIIAKQNNAIGLSGIAPKCKVMPIRMLTAGGGYAYSVSSTSVIYESFRYAIIHGASILSMSWAVNPDDDLIDLAVHEALTDG